MSDFDFFGTDEDYPEEFDFGDIDLGDIDFGDIDLSSLDEVDLSGLQDLDPSTVDFGPEFDQGTGGDFGSEPVDFDLSSDDMRPDMQMEMQQPSEEKLGLTRSLSFGEEGRPNGGLGFKTMTGRGEIAYVDPETGATGLKSEYFRDIDDLLRTGTPEQIERMTPGSIDYQNLFKATEGEGFDADATRGAGLESMGGAQGLSRYIPAQYNEAGDVIEGTGGTITQLGFLPDKGTRYAIGDPRSWINNPAKTGEKAIVSKSNVVRSTGDPSRPVTVTTEKGQPSVKTGDNKTIIDRLKEVFTGKTGTGGQGQGMDWMKLLLALAAMSASRGGGSSSAVIPTLSGGRSQTPYGELMKQPGYRPGQGGIQYFGPMVYRATGGGIASLDAAGGRLLQGPGDGVSDDIVAQIGDDQPARLADGEYVLDARTVSEIGNGSTDAGAKKIAQMVERIHSERKTAQRGKPSNADKHLLA